MNQEVQPFLYLPFKEQEYRIPEGWRYSEEEEAIHGRKLHRSTDFELPPGTEVLAAADGIAIASYQHLIIKDDGIPRLYEDKTIGFGLGNFVQIYHPENGLYTIYAHLEKVSKGLKFHRPLKRGDIFWPVGHKVPAAKLSSYQFATEVKRGDVIGLVGDTGLTWGYEDYPQRPDSEEYPSWDTPHLHFEVLERVGSKMLKRLFDPYGIYENFLAYPDSFKSGVELGTKGPVFWVLDSQGKPTAA